MSPVCISWVLGIVRLQPIVNVSKSRAPSNAFLQTSALLLVASCYILLVALPLLIVVMPFASGLPGSQWLGPMPGPSRLHFNKSRSRCPSPKSQSGVVTGPFLGFVGVVLVW